jgi:hypothetical protein
VLVELFRPDQPRIPGTALSYSALVSLLMAVAGMIILLIRFGKIKLGSFTFPDAYQIAPEPAPVVAEKKPAVRRTRRVVRRKRE